MTPLSDKKLILFALCLGCITISFNVAAIAAAVPAISSDLYLSDILVSRIIPFYMIPYGIGALIYAPLTKKIKINTLLVASMAVYAFSSLFCASVFSLGHFLFARVVCGLSGAGAIPLGLIIIGKIFSKEVRGRLVGLFFSCSFIASVAGIFISGIANWRWLFFIPSLLGFATSIFIFGLLKNSLNGIKVESVNYLNLFYEEKIRRIFLFIFTISLLWHGVRNWLGVYLSQIYLMEQITISSLFIVMALSGIIGQNIGGYLADKKGRMYACYLGILMLAIATMLLSGVFPIAILAAILAVLSLGWTIGHNGVSTILTDFPDEHRPEIASLNSSVRFISGGVGFFISSLFVEQSFGLTFLIFGIFMLILSFFTKRIIPEV